MATIRRASAGRTIGATVEKLVRPVFGRRGFSGAGVITDWQAIVGEHLARHSRPDRIAHDGPKRDSGTLHLRVDSASLATELMHLEPQLLERVNTYFGYRAVARLRIVNAPIARPEEKPRREARSLDAGDERRLAERLELVDDPGLKAALERLGRGIAARSGDR